MTDILAVLKSYLDDPTVVMSRRIVNDTIAEIERLRAELAAERERTDHADNDANDAEERVVALTVERANLRAELAAERKIGLSYLQKATELSAERDALRADLRDELERADAWHKTFLETQKHNDELRALLLEASEYVEAAGSGDSIETDHARDLCTRIIASLNKGGADE